MIDVHTHVVPLEMPFSSSGRSAGWPRVEPNGDEAVVYFGEKPFRTVKRSAWDTERRLEEMETSHTRRQVLSPMPELFCYWAEPRAGAEYCREINEWLGAQVGERFDGFGIVPLQDPQLAASTLGDVKSLGLRGVEIGSNVNGEVLHSGRYDDLFAEAARLDLAIFIHPFHPHGFETIHGDPAASGVTFPNEVGFTLGSLIAEGVLDAHPDLRLYASHGGGSLGLLLGRLDRMWKLDPSFRERLPEIPSSYARRIYVDSLVFSAVALDFILQIVGSDQVVVGSDYPFMPDPPGEVLDDMSTLDQADRRKILEDNARRLLNSYTD